MTEAELLRHARNFMWLAEFQPSEVGRLRSPGITTPDYDAIAGDLEEHPAEPVDDYREASFRQIVRHLFL